MSSPQSIWFWRRKKGRSSAAWHFDSVCYEAQARSHKQRLQEANPDIELKMEDSLGRSWPRLSVVREAS